MLKKPLNIIISGGIYLLNFLDIQGCFSYTPFTKKAVLINRGKRHV